MANSCQLEMAKYEADLKKATTVEKAASLFKANMLFNVGGRIADVIGNSLMGAGEIAKQPVAAALDRFVAAPGIARRRSVAEKRAVSPGEVRVRMFNPVDVAKGVQSGLPAGIRDFWQVIKTGTSGMDVNRTETYGETVFETPYIGPAVTTMVNGVLRVVQSMDRPALMTRLHGSLREQARLKGAAQGLAGPELEAYIDRATNFALDERGIIDPAMVPPAGSQMDALIAQSVGDNLRYLDHEDAAVALHDAQVAVFQDQSTASNAMRGLKQGLASGLGAVSGENPAGKLVSEILFPFTKTPSNAAQRVAEYSPAGLAMGYANLRRAYRLATNGNFTEAAHLQRYAVDQMGRSSAGVGALMAGYWLYEQGLLSTGYPKDKGEQGRWEVEGKQENSIKVGDHWLSLQKMAPFGPLMVVGAYMRAAKDGEDGGGIARGALGLAAGIGQTMADQPAFSGAESLAGITESGAKGLSDFLSRTAASMLIPGIVHRWAQWTDPVQREAYLETIAGRPVPESLRKPLGTMTARIPFVSDVLPARHDVLGQEVRRNEGGAEGFFHAFIDPFNSRLDRSQQDSVTRELNRLGVGISRVTRNSGEEREAYYLRRERYGVMLRGVLAETVASPEYQGIAEARRFMARQIPGITTRGVEQRIKDEQREFLESAVKQVRGFFSDERGAGAFTGEFNLPTLEEQGYTMDNALARNWKGGQFTAGVLPKANEQIGEIRNEVPVPPGMGMAEDSREYLRWQGKPESDNVVFDPETVANDQFASPFAQDTLQPLITRGEWDRPPVGTYTEQDSKGAWGYYTRPQGMGGSPARDTIALTRAGVNNLNTEEGQRILPHEFGHAFQARGINPALTREVARYYPQLVATVAEDFPSYAATSPDEHFAETFASAVDLLRDPAENPATVMADVGLEAPAVLLAAQHLLTTPVFRDHPQRDAILALPVEQPMPVLPTVRATPPASPRGPRTRERKQVVP